MKTFKAMAAVLAVATAWALAAPNGPGPFAPVPTPLARLSSGTMPATAPQTTEPAHRHAATTHPAASHPASRAVARAGRTALPVGFDKLQAEQAATVEKLLAGLDSPEYKTRQSSAAALIALHAKYLEMIQQHLVSGDAETREALTAAVTEMCTDMEFTRILGGMPKEMVAKVKAFCEAFPDAYQEIFSPEPSKRADGIASIAQLDDPKALAEPLLLHFLNSTDSDSVLAAARALSAGQYRSDEVVDGLVDALLRGAAGSEATDGMAGRQQGLTIGILDALEQIKSKRAAPALTALLIQAMENQDMCRAGALVAALVATGEKRAIQHLLPMLGEGGGEEDAQGGGVMYGKFANGDSEVTAGDVALLAVLRLTDQNPRRYGMVAIDNYGNGAAVQGFASNAARERGLKKFNQWWDEKKTAEYKDLKPLDLPSVNNGEPEIMVLPVEAGAVAEGAEPAAE